MFTGKKILCAVMLALAAQVMVRLAPMVIIEAAVDMAAPKVIALEHAGLASTQFSKMKIDHEDGVEVYELKFRANGVKYKYGFALTKR